MQLDDCKEPIKMDTVLLNIQELKQAISGLKSDKAPSVDKIRVEMPKAG